MLKEKICLVTGSIGSTIAYILGGWSTGLQTLLIFMLIDLLMGFINAGVFKNSPKSDTGGLKSKASFEGLCKKGIILVFVLIGYRLDLTFDLDYIKNTVIISFIASELISIVENAGLMGIKLPQIISDSIDILNKKTKDNSNKKEGNK